MVLVFASMIEALKGGSHYPFNYFEKYPISLKDMANIPKIQKALHVFPISLKLIQVSCIPLNIYKNIPYPFKFLANIPVSLKTLPGPHESAFDYMQQT